MLKIRIRYVTGVAQNGVVFKRAPDLEVDLSWTGYRLYTAFLEASVLPMAGVQVHDIVEKVAKGEIVAEVNIHGEEIILYAPIDGVTEDKIELIGLRAHCAGV